MSNFDYLSILAFFPNSGSQVSDLRYTRVGPGGARVVAGPDGASPPRNRPMSLIVNESAYYYELDFAGNNLPNGDSITMDLRDCLAGDTVLLLVKGIPPANNQIFGAAFRPNLTQLENSTSTAYYRVYDAARNVHDFWIKSARASSGRNDRVRIRIVWD